MERGLLDAANGVDDLHLITSRKAKNREPHGEAEQEDVNMEDAEAPGETEDQFVRRINLYVAVCLARAPSSKRDDYKDILVYQARKEVISQFLKAAMLKKCLNRDCGS